VVIVLDNVRADGRLEDIGERVAVLAGRTIGAVDSDGRTRHRCCCGLVRESRGVVVVGVAKLSKFAKRNCECGVPRLVDLLAYCGRLHSRGLLGLPSLLRHNHMRLKIATKETELRTSVCHHAIMASPPAGGGHTAHSPTNPSHLALPRQRPTLALPSQVKSRKPSLASSASSAHPLRQTSFPPADSLEAQHAHAEDASLRQYSPSAGEGSFDDLSDAELTSAISGPVGDESYTRKRKRGEKRARGRPPKYPPASSRLGSVSLANGEDGRSGKRGGTAGAPSVITGEDADAEDDEDDEGEVGGGRVPVYEGGQMTQAELSQQRERGRLFYEAALDDHKERLRSFGQAKLRTADVRRLVNQTLSQSVPQSVVLVVSSYMKMFAGMLIEEAREVQKEWEAVEERRADGEANRALKRLKRTGGGGTGDAITGDVTAGVQMQIDHQREPDVVEAQRSPPTQGTNGTNGVNHTQSSHTGEDIEPLHPGGAGGLANDISEWHRGPLLPDHLREALRRYKKRRTGGTVGFTGLSLEGRENTAARMAGRRLFK